MGLGRSFYMKGAAVIIGIGFAALVGFALFDRMMVRFGIIGGTVIVIGILLLIAYFHDRSHQRHYDDEEPGS